jgi:hypothetical protein
MAAVSTDSGGANPAISEAVSTDAAQAKAATKAEVSTDVGPLQHPGRAPSGSACEPYRELIAEALGRGRNAMAIWQDLVDDHGFTARYASVRRFVVTLRGTSSPEARVVIATAPGFQGISDTVLTQFQFALARTDTRTHRETPYSGACRYACRCAVARTRIDT